jgi:prepilin-type N-terminal cleavage/methylation domain-containing protein
MATLGKSQRGFSLLEMLIAMVVMVTGLTALLGLFGIGISHLQRSRESFIAKEKAREAFESIYGARNAGQLSWNQIANAGSGGTGVFLTDFQPLRDPGPDGIVDTLDDGAPQTYTLPGPDGILGTPDDVVVPLTNFTRKIDIIPASTDGTQAADLKQITITVRVNSAAGTTDYTFVCFISEYH